MVAVFVGLKLRLLGGAFRSSSARAVLSVVGLALGLGATVFGVSLTALLRTAEPEPARTVLVIGGSLLVLAWTVLPILMFGVDETIDPGRFALLPIPRRTLLAGMLAAGLTSVPAGATTLIALSTAVAWWRGALPVLFALVGAVLAVLVCVVASRTATTALIGTLRSRRARDVLSVVAVLLLSSVGLLQLAGTELAGAAPQAAVDRTVEVLAWTPLGAAWAAPYDAVTGAPLLGVARLTIATATLLLLLLGWSAALRRSLEGGHASAESRPAGTTVGLVPAAVSRLLPAGAVGAIAARTLLYQWRDPRQRINLLAIPVVLVVIIGLPSLTAAPPQIALLAGPAVGALVGLTMLNHTALDGTALWTHLAAALPGHVDRRGRTLGTLVWSAPLVVVAAVAGALLADRPDLAPATTGAGLTVLLAGLAVAAVTSVVAPFPAPPPGANPFATPSGGNVTTMAQQLAASLVLTVTAAPSVALLAVLVFWQNAAVSLLLLLAGPAYGWLLLRVGNRIGGRRLDERGPEIMARIAPSR